MTQPKDRGSDGMYTHPITGEKFPSYSSVMGMLDKPALKYWAANKVADTATYHPNVVFREQARILREAWFDNNDLDPQEAYYHALRGMPWRYTEQKADLGTAVHSAIENYTQDVQHNWPDDVAPFMKQFEGFLREYKPYILAHEVTVYNRTIGYAGTLDMLAVLDVPVLDQGDKPTETAIIDIKTGKDVYPDAAVQQNAYANGEVWFDPWQQKDVDMPKIDAAYILHVRPDFYRLIPVTLSQHNFDVFCALREVWEWDRNYKPTALGKGVKVRVK